tara:strand:+ start:513 stop:698 length:186 start_codon:yes stop_codon:yes gene_type:complete
MPIWLRKFTFYEIQNHFDKQEETHNNASKKGNIPLLTSGGKTNKEAYRNVNAQYKGKTGYK